MSDEILTAAPARTFERPAFSLRFSARDLIRVAIFAVIYFVVVFAVAMLGIISPLAMLITLPLAPIIAGIPYLLFLTRVRHAGMVTLFGVVVALIYLLMGHPWQSTVLTIVTSLLAELILWAGGYRSKWASIWAYTVFSIWFVGPWIPFFLDPAGYIRAQAAGSMGTEYMEQFTEVITVPAILIMVGVSLVCGFLGGLLGSALLRKHFVKAGLA